MPEVTEETMLISVTWDLGSWWWLWSMLWCRQCGCPWSLLPMKAVLMSTAWVTTKGYGNVRGLCCPLDLRRCPQSTLPHWAMLQFMVHFAVGGHIDVPGLCYGLKLCWCQWSMWPLRAVLLSVTSVLAHVDVHVTMLPSKVMGMSEVCAATWSNWCQWTMLPLEAMLMFLFCSFVLEEVTRVEGMDLGGLESECDRGVLCEISK